MHTAKETTCLFHITQDTTDAFVSLLADCAPRLPDSPHPFAHPGDAHCGPDHSPTCHAVLLCGAFVCDCFDPAPEGKAATWLAGQAPAVNDLFIVFLLLPFPSTGCFERVLLLPN